MKRICIRVICFAVHDCIAILSDLKNAIFTARYLCTSLVNYYYTSVHELVVNTVNNSSELFLYTVFYHLRFKHKIISNEY